MISAWGALVSGQERPYAEIVNRQCLPGFLFSSLVSNSSTSIPTSSPDTVYLHRLCLPWTILLRGLTFRLGSTAPNRTGRNVKTRLYAINPSTGRPTQALTPELLLTYTNTAFSLSSKSAYPSSVWIPPQPILLAATWDTSGVTTAGTLLTLDQPTVGPAYTEQGDILLSDASITYAGGLPSTLASGLTSPTWTTAGAATASGCLWSLLCDKI